MHRLAVTFAGEKEKAAWAQVVGRVHGKSSDEDEAQNIVKTNSDALKVCFQINSIEVPLRSVEHLSSVHMLQPPTSNLQTTHLQTSRSATDPCSSKAERTNHQGVMIITNPSSRGYDYYSVSGKVTRPAPSIMHSLPHHPHLAR